MFDTSFLTQPRFQVDPAVFISALNDSSSSNNTSNNNNNNNNETPRIIDFGFHNGNDLPHYFVPCPMDVIAGRGKACSNHPGNKRFRQIIDDNIDRYSCAKTKMDKSLIVNDIVDEIRAMSPSGGFVRKDKTGRWRVLDDATSREKVGHAIRDALSFVGNKKKRPSKQISQSQWSSSEDLMESDEMSFEMFQQHMNGGEEERCAVELEMENESLVDVLFEAQKVMSEGIIKNTNHDDDSGGDDDELGSDDPLPLSKIGSFDMKHCSFSFSGSQQLLLSKLNERSKQTKLKRSALTITARSA